MRDIRNSLKILSNDMLTIIDLLDQKLGIDPEESEQDEETSLEKRKQ